MFRQNFRMYYILLMSCLVTCRAQFADELQTYEKECLGEDKFTCLDGTCISQDDYCDGSTDCPDGSDENFCPDHPPNEYLCNITHQFMCHDGHSCIPATWVCNNEPDCTDASDEADCSERPVSNITKCGKSFRCKDGTCISSLWACDGHYDCEDRSDEDIETCRQSIKAHALSDGYSCEDFPPLGPRRYTCVDSSFCLMPEQMCDNVTDCRDNSDEGPFCAKWHTMCDNTTCPAFITTCSPERTGPRCLCNPSPTTHQYNKTTKKCEDIDECQMERPSCSHSCKNYEAHFRCECEPGYKADDFKYLCFAEGPEAMLLYSTAKDIRYITVKTKKEVIIATGIKKSHGVSFDGKHLYWVETAEGHQAIARAQMQNVAETKEILVSLGLYDAGDIAVDWLGKNIYFTDESRGAIYVCTTDGSICTRLNAATLRPKFVTLDVKKGLMYWADVAGLQGGHVIMRARMDGSGHEVMTASLNNFAKGLALDAPNDRLYFVDVTIMVLKVDTKQLYPLFQRRVHHPYAIAVFENTVYWSDWTSNTIQTTDKLHLDWKRNALATLHGPVYGLHIYHPVLYSRESNQCGSHKCSHLCLLTSNVSYSCACPIGMKLNGSNCYNEPNYRPQYLIVGAGASFTRIRYDTLGNPEAHATNFDIGRVQAMAYDSKRDTLYIYDGMRKSIVKIEMTDFTLGVTHVFAYNGLENVVDMDYDYVTDNLYVLDSGRRFLEVFSLKDGKRALLHRFPDQEIPVSFCILQHFGRLLVAVVESEQNNEIHIDSISLDGDEREHHHIITDTLRGPRVRLRNLHDSDMVAVSDEGSNAIEFIHLRTLPRGGVRQDIRKGLPTAASSLAVTMPYVFWSDGRTPRVFWDEYLGETSTPRRVELSIFPNETHLHFQATTPPPDSNNSQPHPCTHNPCSHICVQTPTLPILGTYPSVQAPMSYKCLCPPGQIVEGGICTRLADCRENQAYCYKSNECIPMMKRCDGVKDCKDGEDEDGCSPSTPDSSKCGPTEVECNGGCIQINQICPQGDNTYSPPFYCEFNQFKCRNSRLCLERELVCDGHQDCPDGSDEGPLCHTLRCLETEFMCTTGNCILGSWRCDGDSDCTDGSDEADCSNRTCNVGSYQCRSGQCVDIQRRCDGQPDCVDGSDEERCQEPFPDAAASPPSCGEGEFACEMNKSICLPQTAWCNNKDECPGGTDEHGCSVCGPRGLFECKQEQRCLSMKSVCNHNKECSDGSDETPEACALVNRTSNFFVPPPYPPAECHHGFLCGTGQCIEWRDVCDQTPDCFDESDENGQCFTACEKTTCTHICQATPQGQHCKCKPGYRLLDDRLTCVDVDECSHDPCAQQCVNFPGSFLCSCREGYNLRSNRRSCKADIQDVRSVIYATGHTVKAMSEFGRSRVEFDDSSLGTIADIDINIAREKIYLTSPETGKLLELTVLSSTNKTSQMVITNIGKPTKIAVDWVTGNVYFVDNSTVPSIKVCNFDKKRCAKLKDLPTTGTVVALKVSPSIRKLFYSINYKDSSEVSSVDLNGQNELSSQFRNASVALAVDGPVLYVATVPQLLTVDPGRSYKVRYIRDWYRLVPENIFLFEDNLFVSSEHRLFRCLTVGEKSCLPYIFRMPDTQALVMWHPTLQTRYKNECYDFVCENVCVLGQLGPKCVCEDGKETVDGKCAMVDKSALPLFNGVQAQGFTPRHHVLGILVGTTLLLMALYAAVFFYYHCVYRRRNETTTLPVRFQNQPSSSSSSSHTPIIDMPTTSGYRHEFTNPMQYVRNVWRRSTRRNRPLGADGGVSIEIPRPREDVSDTESDRDNKDDNNLVATPATSSSTESST